MMAPQHVEWLNENAQRAFPLKENAVRRPVNTAGAYLDVQLPNFLVVDFVLSVPAVASKLTAYISRIVYVGTTLALTILDGDDVQIASLVVDLATHTANKGYELQGVGAYSDVRGRVVLGDLGTSGARLAPVLTPGQYDFTLAGTEFEFTTIRPNVRLLRSLQIVNNGAASDKIYDDVRLIAGENVVLTYIPETNAIRIDVRPVSRLTEECPCSDQENDNQTCIEDVNGLDQNIDIVGDGQCISVETDASTGTIRIIDTCSKPCCSCPELDFVVQQLKIVEGTLATLQTYSTRLEAKISSFVTNYVMTVGSAPA